MQYVKLVQATERREDAEIELRLFGVEGDETEFLLGRLKNPVLRAAVPITLYRLGQFGGREALEYLESQGISPLMGEQPELSVMLNEVLSALRSKLGS